jgi:signal transduction histidine kinase
MMKHVIHSLLFVALYVAAAWFGFTFSNLPPNHLSVIWLPSGIAVVGLVTLGWRALPLIFVASSLVNWPDMLDFSTSEAFAHSIGHALLSSGLDTLQPSIGAWMYGRVCKNGCLFNEKSFILFIAGVALMPTMLTGWALILNFHLGGYVAYADNAMLMRGMMNTTLTDALGIFITVPVYDALIGLRGHHVPRRDYIEFVALILLLGLFLVIVTQSTVIRPIVLLVPLTGLALRNGVVGSAVGFLMTSVVLIIATVSGRGPYSIRVFELEFFSLMTYLLSLGLPVHLIAISIRNVKRLAVSLEQRVEERTSELKQKEARLTELNQDKDRLMSIIGHDLRNPIQGIIGLGELVVSDMRNKDHADVESYGVMIQSSARQSLQLLQNLMDWSATQSGRIRFNPQPTDVSRLLSEALHVVADTAKAKGITLQVDVEMGLTASVDKQMMATILRNLVSNSLKFTSAGGTILTSAHSTEKGFRLSVTDTGVGMTEEQIEALEGPLSNLSTHGTEGEPGSGLGLLLVNEFTHKHGGTVRIESELGRGTTFELDFPAKP